MLGAVAFGVASGWWRVSMHVRSVDSRLLFGAVGPGLYWVLSWFNVGAFEEFLHFDKGLGVWKPNVGLYMEAARVRALLALAGSRAGLGRFRGDQEVFWLIIKNCEDPVTISH